MFKLSSAETLELGNEIETPPEISMYDPTYQQFCELVEWMTRTWKAINVDCEEIKLSEVKPAWLAFNKDPAAINVTVHVMKWTKLCKEVQMSRGANTNAKNGDETNQEKEAGTRASPKTKAELILPTTRARPLSINIPATRRLQGIRPQHGQQQHM